MRVLDQKDVKILWELYNNSRQSIKSISRKVLLPKDTVNYRINQMIKKDIILKFLVSCNPSSFGLSYYVVFIKVIGINEKKKQEHLSKIKAMSNLCWLISTVGRFNVVCAFLTRTRKSVFDCSSYLRFVFKDSLVDMFIGLTINGIQYSYPFFRDFKNFPLTVAVESTNRVNLDELDSDILCALTKNSRITTKELSEKTKSTPKTIKRRIHNLEKKKMIQQYFVYLDPKNAGYNYSIFLIKMKTLSKEFEKYVKNLPEIFYFSTQIGFIDYQLDFYANTEDRMYEIEDELYNLFGVLIDTIDIIHVKKQHTIRYYIKD